MRHRRHSAALAVIGVVIAAQALAVAAGGLKVTRKVKDGLVVAELSAPDIVDQGLRERIKSGLTNRLVIEAKLVPEGFGAPLFTVTRTVEIVYDLWEERYLIEVEGGGPTKSLRAAKIDEVAKLLRQKFLIELGAAAACETGRRYRVDATLTVNPVSAQVMQRSREMLAPSPSERGGAPSRSLFGSVARVFFNVSADPGVRELRGLSPYEVVRPKRGKR